MHFCSKSKIRTLKLLFLKSPSYPGRKIEFFCQVYRKEYKIVSGVVLYFSGTGANNNPESFLEQALGPKWCLCNDPNDIHSLSQYNACSEETPSLSDWFDLSGRIVPTGSPISIWACIRSYIEAAVDIHIHEGADRESKQAERISLIKLSSWKTRRAVALGDHSLEPTQ